MPPGAPEPPEPSPTSAPVCYRHKNREAHIRCQRCSRPICPDCMRTASVGFQCPSCVSEGSRSTRSGRTAYGGLRPGNPARTSQVLIAINVAVWILITATGGNRSAWVLRLALLPVHGTALIGGVPESFPGVADGAYWQLLTSIFTHVEIWHIGFNMVALWFLGPQLEAVLGRARFLGVYLLAGLTGSAAVYWLSGVHTPTLGASGALFGLMGALLVVVLKVRGNPSQILMWIGLNFLFTFLGRGFISWQGHLGGFVGGILVTLVFAYAPRPHRTLLQALGAGAIAVLIALAVAARTLVLT
ncbi:MAG TPA: rhomboid family intramembrane serine protease [Nocardioidaceae bacterium]|nr:rhomboid family intramembrane serine protease [Nocardioidaceae bacterium]